MPFWVVLGALIPIRRSEWGDLSPGVSTGESVELTKLGPESHERLALFIGDLGEIRCHSDLLILQQEWALGPCLQEDLPSLLMLKEARSDRAGHPEDMERGRPTL
ncbi:hypothetical protein NDU88_002705 [Pleurodeles waltl]|uniref:Uncharacterized protein n=1 Tax=Pleurodeles waltl TaxID=8319 RepID=A0AAV7KWH1_PLEWA|nr:hypothetical protein NDU88_002705 [Pleurodeles waltl]